MNATARFRLRSSLVRASASGAEIVLLSFEGIQTQAPSGRPVPAVLGIAEFVPTHGSHKLETTALECLIERQLRVGITGQRAFGADVVGRIKPAGRKSVRSPLN